MWWRGLDTSYEIGWRQGEACPSKQYIYTSLKLSDSVHIFKKNMKTQLLNQFILS